MDRDWFEFKDVKRRTYNTQVWIPLCASQYRIKEGTPGFAGYREEFQLASALAVELSLKNRALEADANDVIQRVETHAPYRDGSRYVAAEIAVDFVESIDGLRLVLEQRIPGVDRREWHLNQDFVLGLNLMRIGDIWVRVEEGRTEVARLHRTDDGKPMLLEANAEYLKDYLCARNMGLVVGSYIERVEVAPCKPNWSWNSDENLEKSDEHGWRWRGEIGEWHEGGMPYGQTWTVFEARRTDYDPEDEVPNLSVGGEIEAAQWTTAQDSGAKVYRISGELWRTEWIAPAENSPRVGCDSLKSTAYFSIDAAGTRVSGDDLENGLHWLWFRPDVVNDALGQPDGQLEWYSSETGDLRFAPDQGVHFGLNERSFVNVLAVDIARLPLWSQSKWAGHNVPPTGRVSLELTASQVSVRPASTTAPETEITAALKLLESSLKTRYGIEVIHSDKNEAVLLAVIHRFKSADRDGLLNLAKDLTRLFADRLDAISLQEAARVKPQPPLKPLGSLKALEKTLATITGDPDARSICGPLFGIYDLRLRSAHLPGSGIDEALRLAGVDSTKPMIQQGQTMIESFNKTVIKIATIFGKSLI